MKQRKFNFKNDYRKLIPMQRLNIKLNLPWQKFKIDAFRDSCLKAEKEEYMFIFEKNNKICGWLWLSSSSKNLGHIKHIQVPIKFQKKGIAKKLLDFAINFFKKHNKKKVTLKVTKSNKRAISIYEAYGFKKNEEDEKRILMELNLK